MTPEQQKEQYCFAYIRAVAAVARVNLYHMDVVEDSIDIGFAVKSYSGNPSSPRLEAQLKCVTQLRENDSSWVYDLKAKNYDELRGNHFCPHILIVLLIPPTPDEWLVHDENAMSLRRCAYWLSLRDPPPSANTSSVTVTIPRAARFAPDSLRAFLPLREGVS